MNDFLKFFDKKVETFPMHLEITYSKITDWGIMIYKKCCGEKGEDILIADVQSCDVNLCFARAEVALKEWLSEHEGGY
ncbi:MAG: hypothetical protein NC452_04005 [Eubacterium sp.]|nr:hypothetical protein [Eubacterium sp.]